MQRLWPIYFSVFLSALAYGVTFPLLSLQVERMGVSPELVGLNAAMPALGWLIVSPFVPRLQALLSVKILVIGFLAMAAAGFAGVSSAHDYAAATAYRLLFGGAIGMHYRIIEYLLNAHSADQDRGRNFGVYSFVFLAGIAIGAALQPSLGTQGIFVLSVVLALLGFSVLPLLLFSAPADPHARVPSAISWARISLAPVAFLAALVYGLFESIPAYLLPIYAVKNGLGDDVAAYAVSAATLGALVGPIPIGILSDRYNRMAPLFACGVASILASAFVPFSQSSAVVFLAAVALLGFTASCVYDLALAMIGDRARGQELVEANAAFGFIYALGSLFGPVINGAALGTVGTHGLMVSSGLLFAVLALGILVRHFQRSERSPA